MTIITELLISECQGRNVHCVNSIINTAINKSVKESFLYNLSVDLENEDYKKLIINYIIIEICEFKKRCKQGELCFFIKNEEYSEPLYGIIVNVLKAMELFKPEKSKNFLYKFLRYVRKNNLTFIKDVYLKQSINKLALIR
jgi:hypothetical protein